MRAQIYTHKGIIMKSLKIFAASALVLATTACSTTTVRSIQEMESNNGQLYLKYGEVVYKKELFSSKLISNTQKVAECETSENNLTCKSLNVTIDGEELITIKK